MNTVNFMNIINQNYPLCALREMRYFILRSHCKDGQIKRWEELVTFINGRLFQTYCYPTMMDNFNDLMNPRHTPDQHSQVYTKIATHPKVHSTVKILISTLTDDECDTCVGNPLCYGRDVALKHGFSEKDISFIEETYKKTPLPITELDSVMRKLFN